MKRLLFPLLTSLVVILGLFLGLQGCTSIQETNQGILAARKSAITSSSAPTFAELKNGTYSGFEDIGTVTLIDGNWHGKPYSDGSAVQPEVTLLENFSLTGDLDGDGAEEAVVLLSYWSGGTGHLLHIAVVGLSEGKPKNIATVLVGDRVQIRGGRIAVIGNDRQILLDVVRAGLQDAACCPGEVTTLGWILGPNNVMKSFSVIDKPTRLSVKAIGDTEWVLKAWNFDEPAPINPEVTLIYRDGQFVGKSGCNRFFVSVKDREMAGDISVGLGGSTKMACPDSAMAVEDRFLDLLSRAKKFGFMVTKLALSYEKDGTWKVMLFESRKAQPTPVP